MKEAFDLELKYDGVEETVRCHQNDLCFRMEINTLQKKYRNNLVSATYERDGTVTLKYDNKTKVTLDKTTDPERMGFDYVLGNVPLTNDEMFAGCTVSHQTYWAMFRKNYIRSITYTYYHTYPRPLAKQYIKEAIDAFDKRIKLKYNVDVSVEHEMPEEDRSLLKGIESIAAQQISNMRH